ncbi:hypothetical protein RZS08_43325, partial [Arthrospira platensis SPKY1]|nr:hypothetical protein [Arthrospira platensis SPKY1]
MKKSLLAVALTAVFLVACGKKEEPTATAPAPAETTSKVLNIYTWDDYIPEGMIAAFEQETGIK